jgi:hypothetical protein
MRFAIPQTLLVALQDRRPRSAADNIELAEEAFLLFPGMGAPLYLTSDGRVLRDGREWDEASAIVEGTDDDAVAAIVIGAEDLNLPELLALLPPAPLNAVPCSRCGGSRWWNFKDYYGKPAKIICPECRGRSWLTASDPTPN